MSDVNVVCLSGGLTRDPELREIDGGSHVLNFGLGFSESFVARDGQAVERNHYVDVAVFGNRAAKLQPILRKGMKVTIQGHLVFSSWEKDGQKRSKVSVVADEIALPPKPKQGDGQAAAQQPQAAPSRGEGLPWDAQPQQAPQASQGALYGPSEYNSMGYRRQDVPPSPPSEYVDPYYGY